MRYVTVILLAGALLIPVGCSSPTEPDAAGDMHWRFHYAAQQHDVSVELNGHEIAPGKSGYLDSSATGWVLTFRGEEGATAQVNVYAADDPQFAVLGASGRTFRWPEEVWFGK